MEQTILFIVLIVVILGFGLLVFILNQRLRELKNSSAVELMKTDVTELTRSISLLQQNMGEKLDRSNTATQTSIERQLSESAKLITDVTQRLAKLDETDENSDSDDDRGKSKPAGKGQLAVSTTFAVRVGP